MAMQLSVKACLRPAMQVFKSLGTGAAVIALLHTEMSLSTSRLRPLHVDLQSRAAVATAPRMRSRSDLRKFMVTEVAKGSLKGCSSFQSHVTFLQII